MINDIGRLSPAEGCTYPTTPYDFTNYWKNHDHGVYCEGGNYVYIQNNVFYNIQRGQALQVYSGNGYTSTYVYFINNTCENGNYNSTVQGHVVLFGSMTHGLIANNVFKDQYSTAIQVAQVSYTYSDILVTKNMCSGGNAVYGAAVGVTITNNYNNMDPKFVDEANHNYALQSTSPAINVGYATGLTTDYLKNPRSTIDLGAYEYQGGQSPTVYWNVLQSGTATRNNCATGYTGSTVTYTVSAGTYSSTTSQATADALAMADVTTNKQTYANANGTCNPISSSAKPLSKNGKTLFKNGATVSK